ncbi:MAG TPA: hypothetical protein VG755_01795 [Nannocystaceae bacterium]|nr:hypothetical protein [Nannocystaceae bacterium]
MNERIEPLQDDPGDPLARLVARARADEIDYDVEAGLARHLAIAAAVPRAPWWQHWRAGVVVLAIASAAAVLAVRSGDDDRAAVVNRIATGMPSIAPQPSPTIASSIVAPTMQAEPVAASPTIAATAPRRSPRSDDALAREAAQIRRARQRLESGDAKTALAICDAAAREFPSGTFIPERTGIRVLALHELGRPDENAARRYLARWPDGTLASRIRATLE